MSVEEIDDSVTILESGTAKDVTKLARIDFPILNISQKHADIHISSMLISREMRLCFEWKIFCFVKYLLTSCISRCCCHYRNSKTHTAILNTYFLRFSIFQECRTSRRF